MARPRQTQQKSSGPSWSTGMREVGAGIFAYVQATGETGISNAGLIVGRDGAVAVDALMVPSMTRRLVAAIKKTTRKRIGSLINTHHHLDHTGGNQFFRNATIVASAKCREAMVPGFPPVPVLQRFMPAFAREFPLLKMTLPAVTFEDWLVIHDGSHEIHLWHPGVPAHTAGDVTVFLPKERVLFTGDLSFHYVTPLAFQGHVGHWIEAADRVLGFAADVVVPGHGPVGDPRGCAIAARLSGPGAPGVQAPVRRRDAGGGRRPRHQARRVRQLARGRAHPAERDAPATRSFGTRPTRTWTSRR